MLLEKVRKTICENSLINKGDKVLCAVSGGADSICLLNVMLALREELDLKIAVANVNHLIRGEESDRDSEFVKKVCRDYSVECYYREYNVTQIAKERKIGEEECGRILRYEFFEDISRKLGNAKIATAHNLDDCAETVLFRLARGSSSAGLEGIRYSRQNIIRPLLDVKRSEIEKYLRDKNQKWCEDSTNALPIYARNKIRLSVIPCLEEISEGAAHKIVQSSKMIAEDNEFLEKETKKLLQKCFFETYLLVNPVIEAPLPIGRRIAAHVLKKWGAEITFDRVWSFLEFLKKDSGKRFDITKNVYAEKNYDKVCLRTSVPQESYTSVLTGETAIYGKGWGIQVIITDAPTKKTGNFMALFDADELKPPFVVRYRQSGDKMCLKGTGGTKKLSDIFTDEKIDRYERDYIPIVEKDGEILYLCGLRQSGKYNVSEKTKNFLIIKYTSTKER